nr:protein STRUBBELIG-receptor family 6-like isoform X1 [Tanacetum cinerariifolium]
MSLLMLLVIVFIGSATILTNAVTDPSDVSALNAIKLSSLGLSGGIGYQLASLTSLTDFDVSNNNFGNQIPFSLPPNLTS